LSPDERRLYDEQGYLLVRGLFDEPELERFERRVLEIASGRVPPAPEMLVMRDVMVAKGAVEPGRPEEGVAKIQDFHRDEVLFEGYARSPKLLDLVEAFVGPDIKSVHNMLINKPPGVDGRHPLHQDLLYFPFRPAEAIVATWTAIQRCTRENGCLVVLPGSQRGELLQHERPDWEYVNYLYVGAKGVGAHSERVHVEMEPGDTLFFHPILLHGSGQNRTRGTRRAISAHFASARCRYVEGQSPIGKGRPYLLVRGREHEGCI
jgi:phytanoyl-CoA hydroxylase